MKHVYGHRVTAHDVDPVVTKLNTTGQFTVPDIGTVRALFEDGKLPPLSLVFAKNAPDDFGIGAWTLNTANGNVERTRGEPTTLVLIQQCEAARKELE